MSHPHRQIFASSLSHAAQRPSDSRVGWLAHIVLLLPSMTYNRTLIQRLTRLAIIGLSALVAIPLATAQAEPASYHMARGRDGATLGVSLFTGHLGCKTDDGDDCGDGVQPAGGLEIHGGIMMGPRLALLGELWGMTHREDDFSTSQVLLTGNLRAWLANRIWLQGGVGVARSTVRFEGDLIDIESESDTVPAFAVGLGVELIQTSSFGLDLQLRAGRGFYDGDVSLYNLGFGVGASWY